MDLREGTSTCAKVSESPRFTSVERFERLRGNQELSNTISIFKFFNILIFKYLK